MVSPDSLGTACPLSGRNSTYRSVQISETSSVCHQNSEAVRASDQSEDYEGKNEAELAAQVGGTKIPKFGMQSAR
jgi:hypothetical protein